MGVRTSLVTWWLGRWAGAAPTPHLHLSQEMLAEDKRGCWGITLPLVTDEQGSKFGKSAGSPVWLDPDMVSPFDFFQFFLRVPDSSVGSMLRQFTFLPEQEVLVLEEKVKERPEQREAQVCYILLILLLLLLRQVSLARQVTLLVHGQQGLQLAEKTTSVLYTQDVATLASLTVQVLLLFPSPASCFPSPASCFPSPASYFPSPVFCSVPAS